jgi:hypothetical protein
MLVKFELLTKNNYIQAVRRGCTFMHLDFLTENEKSIVLEENNLPMAEYDIFNSINILNKF